MTPPPFVLAHLGHWYEAVLYALPMVVIGGVLWFTARQERRREGGESDAETWIGEDDPQWDDPRLHDD